MGTHVTQSFATDVDCPCPTVCYLQPPKGCAEELFYCKEIDILFFFFFLMFFFNLICNMRGSSFQVPLHFPIWRRHFGVCEWANADLQFSVYSSTWSGRRNECRRHQVLVVAAVASSQMTLAAAYQLWPRSTAAKSLTSALSTISVCREASLACCHWLPQCLFWCCCCL